MRTPRSLLLPFLLVAGGIYGATQVRPGFNLFSRDHDVQLGKEAQQEVEKQVPVVHNAPELERYVSDLGAKLARASQAPDYPYNFHVVADKNINAFALPGGPVYVNTATISAAANEAQLAGVMAHEISHVALRHSTNQASKAYAWQIPVALAGGLAGGSLLGQLTQLGISLGVNSVLLKYSRDAEHDADIVGAQTMARAGYDPIEMARFFETLKAKGGNQGLQFLSDHPSPGNRVQYVSAEVKTLPQRQYTTGSSDFSRYRDMAARVPVPDPKRAYNDPSSGSHPHPEFPSGQMNTFQGSGFRIGYPSNLQPYGQQGDPTVTIAPREGLVKNASGGVEIGMGMIVGYFSPDSNDLNTATNQFVQDLRGKNPDLRPLRGQQQKVVVDGNNGESLILSGTSPLGKQRELDSVLTVSRPQGLFYVILISPESDYTSLRPTFVQIENSIRFQ